MLKRIHLSWLALALGTALAAGPALADKDKGGGHGGDKHGGKHAEKAQKQAEKAEKHAFKQHEKAQKHARKDFEKADKHASARHARRDDDDDRSRTRVLGAAPQRHERIGTYFNDDHRRYARGYFVEHYGTARSCPPGLAKKNNGCMPPGQARKTYMVGQPLPTHVQYYSVPQQVVTYLPPPPYGYRYVRVYDDIVLMSTTDRIIIDVLRNLLG